MGVKVDSLKALISEKLTYFLLKEEHKPDDVILTLRYEGVNCQLRIDDDLINSIFEKEEVNESSL